MELTTKMYLTNGNDITGYETGPSLLQKIGLTTQIPKYRYIATIKYNHNLYLHLIDAIENKDKVNIDSSNSAKILDDYIIRNKIDYERLIAIAA